MRAAFSRTLSSNDSCSNPEKTVGKKIVLVDDSQTFLMYAGLFLKRLKYNVITACDGLECLKLLKTAKADAVLLDLYLPALDGLKVLRHIKRDRRTSSLPVIMVSSDADPGVVNNCMELGAFDYLTKPVKIERLHNVLEKCFFSHRGTNRRHLRERFKRNLRVYCGGKEYEFYAETLSEGGVYLRTRAPFPIGTCLEITLNLDEGPSLVAAGRVIYIKKINEDFMNLPPGMAIQFVGLQAKDAELLKSYITNLLAKDILETQDEPVIEK